MTVINDVSFEKNILKNNWKKQNAGAFDKPHEKGSIHTITKNVLLNPGKLMIILF